jgi:hypothetical protein
MCKQRKTITVSQVTSSMVDNRLVRDGTGISGLLPAVTRSPRRSPSLGSATSSTSGRDRTYVDHTYHDHLHDAEGYDSSSSYGEMECPHKKKSTRGGVTVTFPEKLHLMLGACDEEGLSHVASWLPHGRYVNLELQARPC